MLTRFADFSGGEAGTLDLSKVPPNFWKGKNLLVYRNGALGPRPGLRDFNLGRVPVGNMNGFGHIEADDRSLIYVEGTTVWTADPEQVAVPTNLGNIATEPGPVRVPIQIYDVTDSVGFMTVPNSSSLGGLYRVRPKVPALETCNAPSSYVSSVSGIRVLRADGVAKRFFYSAVDDAFTWPSGNFIDVSIANAIRFMTEQRGHHVIVTADGSWWVLTGVPGLDDVLRRVSGGRQAPMRCARDAFVDVGDDLIHYLSQVNNYPGVFDGVKHMEQPYLTMTPDDPQASYAQQNSGLSWGVKAIQATDNGSVAFILPSTEAGVGPNGRMLLLHNGVWGFHDFGIPVSPLWASNGRGRLYGFRQTDTTRSNVSGTAFQTDLRRDRPAFTSDTRCQPGDATNVPVDAEVTFPEEWSGDADELRVTEVMVDFIRWNTGAPTTNRIIAEVTALARGSEVPAIPGEQTWEQAGSQSAATQAGTPDRVRFNFGQQGTGAGWRLRLHGLRGVAIRQVFVWHESVRGDSRAWSA